MATTTTAAFSSSSFAFIATALAFSLLLSLKTANGGAVQQQQHFYTVQLSSLFPSDSCSPAPSTKGLNKLPVFHKHGPCAQAQQLTSTANQPKPTADEILRQDESRVQNIQSRKATAGSADVRVTDSTTIPAKDGSTVGSGNYVVTVGLGTPAKKLSLILDTGSDVTWTRCQPCVKFCYQQKEKIFFDPSSSKTYRNVSCEAAVCSALAEATGNRDCSSSTCAYVIEYGGAAITTGLFATEKLTLTKTDVFDEFYFGCGQNIQVNFGGAAGVLGLGRNSLSLVSQTSDKYKNLFSYCLPSTPSGTGFLTFGGAGAKSVKYTPIASVAGGENFYGIGITAISVGGKKLPVSASVFSAAGAIIDSGTAITRLPPAAYSALRSAFRKKMSKYPLGPALSILDTCYDLSKFKNFAVPKIGFFFAGGAEVDIEAVGILYANKPTQVCLAFAANGNATDVAILGSVQQQTLEVVYDGAGGRVGFASGGCK
ncbi:unnamed protein product [Linum tenue]|uniref:Peptidase A1 domain-containing protein n=1 Tax=Linum tenue TaxID=586396 RepID=A0AAV0GVJ0_9ROSI|nr:unnamed protein product [Linum tenue]